jgi:hypothetical protein
MHWPMLVLGGGLVALAAIFRLVGMDDFHQHAAPFWLFVTGLIGLFTGGWLLDKDRALLAAGNTGFAATGHGLAGHGFGHGLVAAGNAAVAPVMRPALEGGLKDAPKDALSSLQRPAAKPAGMYATSVGQLSEANVIERIRSLEDENERLRAFLGDANTSISRAERRHAPL